MSPKYLPYSTSSKRFPRVSGDEPAGDLAETVALKFSPRERG